MSSKIYTTKEGDTLDQICAAYYGYTSGTVEAVLSANNGLAELGVVYASGVEIVLPTIETSKAASVSLFSGSTNARTRTSPSSNAEDVAAHNEDASAHADIRASLAMKANATDVAKSLAKKGNATDITKALANSTSALATATAADANAETAKSDAYSAAQNATRALNMSAEAIAKAKAAYDVSLGSLWEYRLFGFATARNGWYPCTGGTMPVSCWDNLVAAGLAEEWATAFGAQTMPNFSGRVLAQASESQALGTSDGTESIALSEDQLPSHSHSLANGTAVVRVEVSSYNGKLADPNGHYLAKTYDNGARTNNLSYIAAEDAGTLGALAGVGIDGSTSATGTGSMVSVMQPTAFAGYWHVYLGL